MPLRIPQEQRADSTAMPECRTFTSERWARATEIINNPKTDFWPFFLMFVLDEQMFWSIIHSGVWYTAQSL
jgi:hypothetical protein